MIHLHGILGFDIEDPACIVKACFQFDAGSNAKFWIQGQPLYDYHKGNYPKAISLTELRKFNMEFYNTLRTNHLTVRHHHERNEVLAKPSTATIRFVAAVENTKLDRLNALHKKYLVQQTLEIDGIPLDVPALIISPNSGYQEYPLKDQIQDILTATSEAEIHFADAIINQIVALVHDSLVNSEIRLNAYEKQLALNSQIIKILRKKSRHAFQSFEAYDALEAFIINNIIEEKNDAISSEIYAALDKLVNRLKNITLNTLSLDTEIKKELLYYQAQE